MSEEAVAAYYGSYARFHCGHEDCGAKNFVYMGQMDDCTGWDREVMKCWSCGKQSWLGDIKEECGYDSFDEGYEEDGKKTIE